MRARNLLPAAALLVSAACSSLPKPTGVAAPAVTQGEAPALAVWTPERETGAAGTLSSAVTYFSSDRDAYAAAFTVTRDGRLRVVWPESPKDDGLVQAGKTYRANGNFAQYGSYMGGARNAVPYTFVLLSEQRLDLTRFGSGSKWKYQVNLEDLGRHAEDAIETVASVVLPSAEAAYSADYAFIAPRLTGQAQLLSLYCGVRNSDARNYAYFRDLWATFDPWDSSLGAVSFASGWNMWPGAFFPISGRGSGFAFYADRASRATAAFWGGCPMLTPFQYMRPFQLAFAGDRTVYAVGPTPGNPTPVDTGSTGDQPGDKLKVKPSQIFGGPGTAVASGATGAAERRARLRERIETRREERVANGTAARAAFRTEQLTSLDVARLERRARMQEVAELGVVGTGEVGGRIGRTGYAGRAAQMRGDPVFGQGSSSASRGRSAAARGTSDGFGGASAGRSASRGDAGSAGTGAGAPRGDGAAARGAGGESRGSGGGESGGGGSRSRTP